MVSRKDQSWLYALPIIKIQTSWFLSSAHITPLYFLLVKTIGSLSLSSLQTPRPSSRKSQSPLNILEEILR